MSGTLRSVATLAAGTAGAQALSFLAAPLLTRLFTPEHFGVLGLFVSITGILGTIVCLRLELTIVLPDQDSDARDALVASVAVTTAVVAATAIAMALFARPAAHLLGTPEIAPYLGLLPLAVGSLGVFLSFNYWSTRNDAFGVLARSQLARSLATNATQLASGLLRAGAGGLIGGQLLGQLTASIGVAGQTARRQPSLFRHRLSLAGLRTTVSRYRRFVLYGSPQALANAANQNLPVLLLAALFDASVAGLYVLAQRVLNLPVNLVGQSVRQAIYPRLNRAHRTGDAFSLAVRITGILIALAVLPAALLVWTGPELFAWILGESWRPAGAFARWLTIWIALGFANAPAVSLIPILELQRGHAVYEAAYLLARVGVLVVVARTGDPVLTIAAFALVGAFFNAALVAIVLVKAHQKMRLESGVPRET